MSFVRKKIAIAGNLQVKWPGNTLDEGFTPFPKRLTRCMGKLFVGESAIDDLRVVLSIVDFTRPDQLRQPSYTFLAFVAGMNVPKFKERVESMREKGWLHIAGTDEAVEITIDGLVQEIAKLTNEEADEDDNPEKN